MSLFTTTARIFRNSLQHIVRNPWHSVTAVLVMVLTLFITSLLGVLLYSSDRILMYLENRLEVTAFFMENTSEDYILNVKRELELQNTAEHVRYISQEEALEIFRQQHIDDPNALEFVTADILPASLSVSARDLDDLKLLAERLADDERVEDVLYQEDVAEQFELWTQRIRFVGFGFSVYLLAMSILILLIVLSLSIREFSKEIEVMRLVGASTGYVRWPFLLDGMLYAVISATISTVAIYVILPYAQEFSSELVSGLQLFDTMHLFVAYVFGGSLLLGLILGITGSMLAIWKHLRV